MNFNRLVDTRFQSRVRLSNFERAVLGCIADRSDRIAVGMKDTVTYEIEKMFNMSPKNENLTN